MTTLHLRKSISRPSLRRGVVFLALTLTCFALSPKAQSVWQKGCLGNDNTAIGKNALINTTGSQNTANGFQALFSNTSGNSNTATGWEALTADRKSTRLNSSHVSESRI